jgi:hypothetical protein
LYFSRNSASLILFVAIITVLGLITAVPVKVGSGATTLSLTSA